MLLGALHDAGAPLSEIQRAIDAVLPDAVLLSVEPVLRAGLRASKVHVKPLVASPPHRTWRDIQALLSSAALPQPIAARATAVFAKLAEVEGAVHGVQAEEVHFHEVGALDSIADVVGVCAALHLLNISTVSASPVALGSGTVRTAHGVLPVPAPAVAVLSQGWRISSGGKGELATPTGLALIRTLASTCEDLPAMDLAAVGVGAGTKDFPDRPNIVRAFLGTPSASHRSATAPQSTLPPPDSGTAAPGTAASGTPASGTPASGTTAPGTPSPNPPIPDATLRGRSGGTLLSEANAGMSGGPADATVSEAVVLEANVDDLDPRLWPGVVAALLAAGASDAWLVPILMKKGRPAHTVTALCPPEAVVTVREQIFRQTTTLGVRESPRRKVALARSFVEVPVGDASVTVKIGHADGVIVQSMPEFEDVAALARRLQIPEREALTRATQAATAANLILGRSWPAPSG